MGRQGNQDHAGHSLGSFGRRSHRDQIWQTLQGLTPTRVYKLLRSLGRWELVQQTLALFSPVSAAPRRDVVSVPAHTLTRIAVDLTPLVPGVANDDAKGMVLALLRQLNKAAPELHFVLLTADHNHAALAALEAANLQCFCVTQYQRQVQPHAPPAAGRLLSKNLGIDILFCPFTAPFFFDPAIPLVSVVYDLQYRAYPQFLSPEAYHERDYHFREACQLAQRLICVSDYVRQTVLDQADVPPEAVTTIPPGLSEGLTKLAPAQLLPVLERFGLRAEQFLLYPAHFWPHKNHRMLLTAFKMYRTRHQASALQLVCTGTPDAHMDYLYDAVTRMGLGGAVSFPGDVSDAVYTALLQSCRALIFPSLYEGFGIPVLEAMAFGKSVLCSKVTSLPEIAGDAGLYFDPRKPAEIVNAIERLESDADLTTRLLHRGYEHLKAFGGPAAMAQGYLQVFREVVRSFAYPNSTLCGVYPDGWLGDWAEISYGASTAQRRLELTLTLPAGLPSPRVSVQVRHDASAPRTPYVIQGGETVTIRQALPAHAGFIELVIEPVFQPKAHAMSEDTRLLGCLCTACRIVSTRGTEDLLADMRSPRSQGLRR